MRHGRDALDAAARLKRLAMCDLWRAFVEIECENMIIYGLEGHSITELYHNTIPRFVSGSMSMFVWGIWKNFDA